MPRALAPAPEPIVDGILYPGELSIIAGAPGTGKSRFLLRLLHGLATGQDGWWGSYPPMKVLFGSQRNWITTSEQLRTVGINELPENFDVFCPPDLSVTHKQAFRRNPTTYLLENVIDIKAPPKVIVLDTLITYLPYAKDFNFNSYSDLTKGCDEIYEFAQKVDCAIPLSHHTAKQKTDSKYDQATEKILGSQAIMAVAIGSCVLEPVSTDDHTYIKVSFMSHLVPPIQPRYFHGSDYHEVSYTEVSTFSGIAEASKVTIGPTEQKVLDLVPETPISYKDFAVVCLQALNLKVNRVYAIVDNLSSKGCVITVFDEDSKTKYVAKTPKM